VENRLPGSPLSEIWETEKEKRLSAGDLKKKYLAAARSRFICNPPMIVLNRDKNWPVALSGRVLSEWRIKSRTRERILSIQLLDTMIAGAQFLKTTKDEKNTPGIEEVSYFENRCKINGKLFKITIIVKKQQLVDRRFVYYYSATECKA
jgi:hypothetical protein